MELPDDVQRAVEQLNDLFRAERTLSSKLEAVAHMIQMAVPGCDAASISLTVEEATITGASTSQLAIEADLVQYRTDEGPCLDAAGEQVVIRIDALAHDEDYEHFAPGAVEVGVQSVLSIPLIADDQTVGSINLYSNGSNAFTDADPARIADHTAYAARLIAASPLYAASTETLGRLIEADHEAAQVAIAVGILIVRNGLGPGEAWAHLRALGDREAASILACAQALIAEHESNGGHRTRSHRDETG